MKYDEDLEKLLNEGKDLNIILDRDSAQKYEE
jgi:hypothetical protein